MAADLQPARARLGTAAVVAVVIAVASVLAGPAPAAHAATDLTIDVGVADRYQVGHSVPVRVRIASDRLLRGTVVVRQGSSNFPGQVDVEVPVEVAGGSVAELTTVLPNLPFGNNFDVAVELRVGKDIIGRAKGTASPAGGDELVGLLPGTLKGDPPAPASLAIDTGVARFAAIGESDLAAAPASLDALDVIGATTDDLTALDPATNRALRRWVADGGQLLVDVAPGVAVPSLPAGWQPGPSGRARAGLGEVRTTNGAMAGGRWAGLIEPTPVAFTQQMGFSGEPMEMTLARDAGLRFPRLNWLLALLAFYSMGVIPMTMFFLRRIGRGELAWVALPVLAVVCTVGAYTAGRSIRDDSRTVRASVLETGDVPWLQTTVGLISRAGGTEQVRFPRGWSATSASSPQFGGQFGVQSRLTAVLDGHGLLTSQKLDAGQFALRSASGPVDAKGGLEVTATAATADTIVGTVRNTLGFPLEEVGVFHDRDGTLVGRLDAGEEKRWTIDVGTSDQPFPGAAQRLWPDASGMNGRPDPRTVVSMGLWSSFASNGPTDLSETGTAIAAGWTRRYQPEVTSGGDRTPGRTMVVGTGPVAPGPGPLAGAAVQTAAVRSPFSSMNGAVNVNDATVLRFTLPVGSDGRPTVPSRLVVRAPSNGKYEAWLGGRWQELTAIDGTVGGGQQGPLAAPGDYALPREAALSGRAWVRAKLNGNDPFLAMLTPVTLEGRE